jgi:outer membrane protein TolC
MKIGKVLLPAVVLLMSASLLAQHRVRRISLDDAKTDAAAAAVAAKAEEIARLSVTAARYHRQAVQADYFPKLSSTFVNLHFNKFLGDTLELAHRSLELPLFSKDMTAVVANFTQPVTPIFKIRQAVNIARADENIAKAKAGQSIAQVESNVERAYFALLIAQREQTLVEKRTVADRGYREIAEARSKVIELTQALNDLLGFPLDTELELVAPPPAPQLISQQQATQQAFANSIEVIEAEQTANKAKAATKLAKLEYVPDVAILGGYTFQTVMPVLPNDFSYIGVVANWTIFDFGKREKTIGERKTNLEIAEAAVELTKAKVASNVQKIFLQVERARRVRDQMLQIAAEPQKTLVSYPEPARLEIDMFQAELDYRMAYAQLRQVIEGR